MVQHQTEAGEVIAGRYRLISPLGEGGMGSVWRAEHLALGTMVAIKLINQSIAQSEEALARFRREAKAAAALKSPHVVQVFDYDVADGMPYIAMEILEGESLASRLARTTVLAPQEMERIITHMCRALSKAHDVGIVHRDLKPDNVFIVRNDDEEIAKLLDFGIAKATSPTLAVTSSSHTQTGTVVGTPHYMSPEQVRGLKDVDYRSDLWAVGVIAYESVLGHRPFDGESLGDIFVKIAAEPLPIPSTRSRVPPGFDAWFARACHRDPGARFSSAKDLAEALRAVLTPDWKGSGWKPAPEYCGGLAPSVPNAYKPAQAETPATFAATHFADASVPMRTTPRWVFAGVGGLAAVGVLAAGIFLSKRHGGVESIESSPVAGPSVTQTTVLGASLGTESKVVAPAVSSSPATTLASPSTSAPVAKRPASVAPQPRRSPAAVSSGKLIVPNAETRKPGPAPTRELGDWGGGRH